MPHAFKFDVAITAADFDTLTADELRRRLEHRLAKAVFIAPRLDDAERTAAATTSVRKTIEKEARVVVVLFQRLWGVTPSSAVELAAVKARIGTTKRKDVVIVPIDNSLIPSWLKGVTVKGSSPTSDAVIDAIVDAVIAAGGVPKKLSESAIAARTADEEQRAKARASFLSSQRALALINRELDSLSTTVMRLCEAQGSRRFASWTRFRPP